MSKKILRVLYRLVVPGGLLLIAALFIARAGIFQNATPSFWQNYPYIVFGIGLVLSAIFNRSRLFFAIFLLALSDRALAWPAPANVHRMILDAVAVLLPLNLLTLSFIRDRGIVSPKGRKRIVLIAAQIGVVIAVVLIRPAQMVARSMMHDSIVPKQYSDWSRLSQPALMLFTIAGTLMLLYLMHRRQAVESGLFWALVTAFIGLNSGTATHLLSAYFAAGGLILSIAVLESSYTMAYRDELTQLPSRRALNENLLKLGDRYTIAMVDVDHFKSFNDTYGHATGDQVLQMIASRLSSVTGGGKAFRYGGEEFAVVFPNKSIDEAYPCLESLRKSVENSKFTVRGRDRRHERRGRKKEKSRVAKRRIVVTVSIGAAAVNGQLVRADEVVRAADKALYRAKANGRNCTVVMELATSNASGLAGVREALSF